MSKGGRDQRPIAAWVTRSAPGAASTAARLADLGFDPINAPLLTFRPLQTDLNVQARDALAFTSTTGVRHAARLTPARDGLVYAVGEATAKAARDLGFLNVVSADGDVEDLVKLILASEFVGSVIHASAHRTAGDLVGQLTAAGVSCRKVAVYETLVSTTLPDPVRVALDDGRLGAVLIHSPRAACAVVPLLEDGALVLDRTVAVGLSEACIRPLSPLNFERLLCADRPTDDALLKTLTRFFRSGSNDG